MVQAVVQVRVQAMPAYVAEEPVKLGYPWQAAELEALALPGQGPPREVAATAEPAVHSAECCRARSLSSMSLARSSTARYCP